MAEQLRGVSMIEKNPSNDELTVLVSALLKKYNHLVRTSDYSMSFSFYAKRYYPNTYKRIQEKVKEQ